HAHSGLLDEHLSLSLLEQYGVPTVQRRLCRSPEEARAAFEELGAESVVVKGCAAIIRHKSELGLVRLRLQSAAAAAEAARQCLDVLCTLDIDDPAVIVAPMVGGGHEFALGVAMDDRLGPLVMIGDGGTLIELRRDVTSLMAPFSEEAAVTACMGLRLSPLFNGYRNVPPLDVHALARAAVALGDFAASSRQTLRSVDVNPLIVLPGGGALAVDAVVEFN
ncbi:acetate--CoA ligase family protein, partial [Bosea sp. TAB14]|uniref:acetate--CoA ligase family protein n=1 Tax=Bosea sp. TAB14 TaxID=3237481 RepID=UPI003F8E7103